MLVQNTSENFLFLGNVRRVKFNFESIYNLYKVSEAIQQIRWVCGYSLGTVGTERNVINDLDLFIECHISPLYFIWCISNIVLSDSDEYPATSA